ncbi:M24 family metallopeptidase [Clostridium oryzae]|uniref:Putative peptidase n=1 Tax=Clostridium oryzae TaxID=1450648 RepID=A0A1V4IQD2_9CLOT|nr:Xaa-Pro peptidase family protein [Clostridium oryzae]OPJ62099.1 putative peptidase [Clostridium oryzae]
MKKNRLEKIIENMNKKGVDQLIISSTASIFYLTGRWIEPGERMLVLYINANKGTKLFVNELFPLENIEQENPVIFNDSDDSIDILSKYIEKRTIAIDKNWPSHFLIRLIEKVPNLKFVNAASIIDEVRMVKDTEEIEFMKKASQVNDKVMEEALKTIDESYTEINFCKKLADIYDKYDTPEFSFYPLIAYGANAAEPHHSSDKSKMKAGDSIILDIGGFTNKYCSDMTRTVFYKQVSDEHKQVYDTVLEANLRGIDAVKPGVTFSSIDKAARDVIDKAGYGKYFTHRTGHNIGIEVHEFPDVSSANDMIVMPGMIFSIEPGIYLPGSVGVRIEDLVVVTETGCEVLNKHDKKMKIVP